MRIEHARTIAQDINHHPEDVGHPRRNFTIGTTVQRGGLPPSKRFPQGADRTVRIMAQGVPGNDATGAVELRPTFAGIPFATDANEFPKNRQMKNPAANIFRRGNPMKIVWRLLKDG